jgi:hypothetical protein
MKKIYAALFVLSLSFGANLLKPLHGNSSGGPTGSTGSPGDNNNNCAGCHSGTAASNKGSITTNIPAAGYEAGITYDITVNITESGRSDFGFSVTAETANGTKAGMFTSNTETQANGSGNAWATHRSNSRSGSGSRSWTTQWTAPTVGTGAVTFYACFNASNANGGTSGDLIYLANATISESTISGIFLSEQHHKTGFFPNPASTQIQFFQTGMQWVKIFDISGKQMSAYLNLTSNTIDISTLPNGVYIMEYNNGTKTFSEKFVKL